MRVWTWLAVACLSVHGALGAAAATSNAATQALWDDFFAHADREAVMASYDVIKTLGDGVRVPSADQCRENQDALTHALAVNPVGLAVWYVGYLCADQLDQHEAAKQRLERFTALVKHGVDGLPPDLGATPMRVVSPIDVEAFIAASGQKLLYEYYDLLTVGRALPFRVALWDEKTQHERWISFDFLDTFERLHGDTATAAPAMRRALARAVLKNFAAGGDSDAQHALDFYDAMRLPGADERAAKLSLLAADGNVPAALGLGMQCGAQTDTRCAPAAIDALLPLVEAHDAVAMVELAAFYAEGHGVPKDEAKARKLLAAADARLGDGRGTVLFASRVAVTPDHRFPPLIRADLETLADRGVPMAAALAGAAGYDDPDAQKSPRTAERLRRASDAGLSIASGVLAQLLLRQGKIMEAQPLLERAAKGGYAHAETALAMQFERGDAQVGIVQDPARALSWYTQAGTDGDVDAMLWLGRHYRAQASDPKARVTARAWFQSADQAGSTPGALERAAMYRDGLGDDEGGPHEALAIYQALSEKRDSAYARRAWADMLREGAGDIARDLPQAKQLLLQDAARGDAQSQYKLGALLLDAGALHDEAAGLEWMRKSADQGNGAALNWLGWAYENGKHVEANAATAVADYRAAVEKGNSAAMLHLGVMAQEGRGMPADAALGFKLLRQSAELDNTEAAWRLGDAYLRGQGTTADRNAALMWYRRSAEQGNTTGMRGLGSVLLEDSDPQRRAEGVPWLQKSAADGNTDAMNDLGLAYLNGNGVTADKAQAAQWFDTCAAKGGDDCSTNAALMKLRDGAGKADVARARAQLESAAAHGNLNAITALAVLLRDAPSGSADEKKSFELYRRCAEAGRLVCVRALGYAYRYGWIDGKSDLDEARRWYERVPDDPEARAQLIEIDYRQHADDVERVRADLARLRKLADEGNEKASLLTAEACLLGVGGTRDGACARHYFEPVAGVYPAAASNLGMLHVAGFGGAVDLDAGERWLRKALDMHYAPPRYELGRLLLARGKAQEGQALLLAAEGNIAAAYVEQRYCREHPDCAATPAQRKAIDAQIDKADTQHRNALAWALATDVLSDATDGRFAVAFVLALPEKERASAPMLDTLAAAQARSGDFAQAARTQQQAIDALEGGAKRSEGFAERLQRYVEGKTWDIPF